MLKGIGNPGRMDCKLKYYRPTTTRNEIGEDVNSFSLVGSVRAARRFKSSAERFESSQQMGITRFEFDVRDYKTLYPIDLTWQVQYDDEMYTVAGIEPAGRSQYLVLTIEKRDNQ